MRIACLGPAGTFAEDALREAAGEHVEPLLVSSVRDAILAVERGEAPLAFVPFENTLEGSVRETLDALAFDTEQVTIVGEHDHAVRPCLIARPGVELEDVEVVVSHPQPLAQCARFIREQLPGARTMPSSSTADAVRSVVASNEARAAIGARTAAEIYGGQILREDVADETGNVTRFVWISTAPAETGDAGDAWRTSLVFSELGEDHPGALVEALLEFSSREVNLTRIESRPLRSGLGRYMFFVDLDGPLDAAAVAKAVEGLREKAESVRVLGSYPVGVPPPLPGGRRETDL